MIESIVDTHTHYYHKRFDSGCDELIRELADNNIVAVIDGAIDFASNKKMKALAIGEIGLDYARDKSEGQISLQKEWFRKFIELAIEKQKPLVIHCREAYDEMIDILQGYKLMDCPGVIHCFSGKWEQAEKLIDMGFYIGVNGMFTKMDVDAEVRVALKRIPLEKIVFETDSPYLVPDGIQGKRNTSKNLDVIVKRFAELRGESTKYICEVVLKNTKQLYPEVFVG